MIDRLKPLATPRALQVGLLVVLLIAAVILADAEGGQQIADDAAVQRSAESVLSATAVTESAAREAVLIGRARDAGASNADEVDHAISVLDRRLDELDTRVHTLAGLIADHQGLVDSNEDIQHQGAALIHAVGSGDTEDAVAAIQLLVDASEPLSDQVTQIVTERQSQIVATREGIATVASAARIVAGLGIPALVLLFLYRGMRERQRRVLLRSELDHERALRKKKDQFLSGASHHLNTPLSAVLGFAELLSDKGRSFNAVVRNEMIEQLAIHANEASHVAEDLLIAARSDMNELTLDNTEVDLRSIVEEVTRSWSGSGLGRVHVTGAGVAQGDRRRITQIVRNLIQNASAHGGEQIKVSMTEAFNRVVLEVADDGEGIPPGKEESVFQPYYSAKQTEGLPPSLGLGLSVARRLARVMGGDLGYTRQEDQSLFRLMLPRAASAASTEVADLIVDTPAGSPRPTDITELIEDGGPRVVYQPIIDMTARGSDGTGTIGFESLARFPFGSPPEWFKAARSVGKGLDLELASIREAIRHFRARTPTQFLAINISDDALTSSHLPEALEGIDPGRLILELSETAVIKNYQNTKGTVEMLSNQGIRLAIDDIGAEEIDLWHVVRLSASVVKIDISLVRDISESATARGLIRAIVAMAEELGVLVIAEGVETETEHKQLLELGVKFGQGYLYGKPEPLEWSARVLSTG
jgi:EAL domain-containing protein (putative c-di-GMP-specific phosphodiesterase class I)/signal transduction histidine kinase